MIIKPPITYINNFIENKDEIFLKLKNDLNWERRQDAPRCEYYCNDLNLPYSYGEGRGLRIYNPQPFHSSIIEIRKKIENFLNLRFEVCFLNRYLNQRDWLGWHTDDSPEMDSCRPIVIISLGVERFIEFKNINDIGNNNKTSVLLEHGSACIMHAGMQEKWYHKIPKASFITINAKYSNLHNGERISLTFRGYKN